MNKRKFSYRKKVATLDIKMKISQTRMVNKGI